MSDAKQGLAEEVKEVSAASGEVIVGNPQAAEEVTHHKDTHLTP